MGSSPLARGLLNTARRYAPAVGIIPARAGFTRRTPVDGFRTPDHPRSRGVYQLSDVHSEPVGGSSPLARGLQGGCGGGGRRQRIIPARAGFTHEPGARERAHRDHPRSRGVYVGELVPVLGGEGSSPLARGLRGAEVGAPAVLRIIPARAGFTGRRPSGAARRPDHPRSRGVYPAGIAGNAVRWGSSPLARGLRSCTR